MTAAPTPGAYIKARRCAAGLTLADVAAALRTEPPIAEHERIALLELIEADIQPVLLAELVAIETVVPIQLRVIHALEQIRQGHDVLAPRICRICAGNQLDPLLSYGPAPFGWASVDLCLSCAGIQRAGYPLAPRVPQASRAVA